MFTKGNWEYIEELGANLSMIANGEVVICGMVNPIECDTYDKELAEMRANANLICSAPLLLEALKEAQLQIEYLHEKFKATGTGNTVLARIQIVLNKAEGK